MNEPNDNERLLRDILAEEGDAEIRDTLLRQTLSLARRRRRVRQLGRAGSIVTVVACLGLLVWQFAPPKPAPTEPLPLPHTLIQTHPLPPAALVKTEPLAGSSLIRSVPSAKIVSTVAARQMYRQINDSELFAMAPAPLVLVRLGPGEAEVVFADPADQRAFLRN